MNIKSKIGAALATGALFAATVMPAAALAATNVTVTGGGAFSYTSAKVLNLNTNIVSQSNSTLAVTGVKATSKTGGNKTSFNTGGSTSITTGAATTLVGVTVGGSTNTNTSNPCGCVDGNTTLTLTGGGAFSTTKATVTNSSFNLVNQSNGTVAITSVNASSNTGDNTSSFNTGGSNSITTDAATTGVDVTVGGSTNSN